MGFIKVIKFNLPNANKPSTLLFGRVRLTGCLTPAESQAHRSSVTASKCITINNYHLVSKYPCQSGIRHFACYLLILTSLLSSNSSILQIKTPRLKVTAAKYQERILSLGLSHQCPEILPVSAEFRKLAHKLWGLDLTGCCFTPTSFTDKGDNYYGYGLCVLVLLGEASAARLLYQKKVGAWHPAEITAPRVGYCHTPRSRERYSSLKVGHSSLSVPKKSISRRHQPPNTGFFLHTCSRSNSREAHQQEQV